MSASWLITDGFSGEANGVNRIVTLGLYSSDEEPEAPAVCRTRIRQGIGVGFCLLFILWFDKVLK